MLGGREITMSDKAELMTFVTVSEVAFVLVELLPLFFAEKLAGKLFT